MNKTDLFKEFDRQLNKLIDISYPKIARLDVETFREKGIQLRSKLETLQLPEIDLDMGCLPFVIVVKSELVPAEKMMELVKRDGKRGVTILRPHTSENFKVINDVNIPEEQIYLLVDIDRGKSNINLPPNEAMKLIKKSGRSPLTVDEGIAIVTQFPEFLIKNNCFSLLASRTGTDQRVPAIWINAKKEPNLGWCWDGNPHTWLGSASCVERVG
jgi:hypothetical protein